MILEGVVSNVAAFGAFVDIGVHQDGLVHISMLSNRFVKDPHEVVKAGDVVQVKVLEVDIGRKRIALTMRLDEAVPRDGTTARGGQRGGEPRGGGGSRGGGHQRGGGTRGGQRPPAQPQGNGMMADALRRALGK